MTTVDGRRRWKSMLHLPEEASVVHQVPPLERVTINDPMSYSNLRAMSQTSWSVSNPEISGSISIPEEHGEDVPDCTGTPKIIETHLEGQVFTFTPTTNRSRQRKFQRHFKLEGEEVLSYYACALVRDSVIVFQGYLYVTRNYFAFFSNVWSIITKEVIAVRDIEKITKTKTAYIIPNAIEIQTGTRKYFFASFFSRGTAYNEMVKVWNAVMCVGNNSPVVEEPSPTDVNKKTKRSRQPSLAESSSESPSQPELTPKAPTKKVTFPEVEPEVVLEEQDEVFQVPASSVEVNSSGRSKKIPGVSSRTEVPRVDTEESHKKAGPKLNLILVRACYVMTFLLTLSAINLYIRIDNLTNQHQSSLHHQQPYWEQEGFRLDVARVMVEKINVNIQRIHLVQKVLAEFSATQRVRIYGKEEGETLGNATRESQMDPSGFGENVSST